MITDGQHYIVEEKKWGEAGNGHHSSVMSNVSVEWHFIQIEVKISCWYEAFTPFH